MNDNLYAANYLAKKVNDLGGHVYFVGGYVRDKFLSLKNKDIDIEVYGIAPNALKKICSELGNVDEVGVSFGILKIHGYDLDISIPRTERKIGLGHKDFSVSVDPYMTLEEAAKRRDFTMNAIMEDVLTCKLFDPYNGITDIKNKTIRHIDDTTFLEDPLRVFRAAQFASRFEFKISDETISLCKQINVSSLPTERIFAETNKALLKSRYPSIYFNILKDMGHLHEFFPELESLIGVEQNPIYHPEGDVWNHTMQVLDRTDLFKKLAENPIGFMYACLFHDIGKPLTTTNEHGVIKSIGHDDVGALLVKDALSHLTNEKSLINYVTNMVRNHMTPHLITESSSIKTTNRFFDRCISPFDQLLLSKCDTPSDRIEEKKLYSNGWWKERLEIYKSTMLEPEVTGEDLIRLGYKPGPLFKDILNKCHLIHLAGVKKEYVIRQLPSIIKGITKKKRN